MSAHPRAPQYRVRLASAADVVSLAALCGQLGYPSTPAEVERRFAGIAKKDEHAIYLAELPGGGVAGWIHVFVIRTVEADARAEVGGLVVDESCRSQGVGPLLMARAEQWAREMGCQVIGLRSNVIRDRAHRFYERLGYTVVKTQKAFRKTL